MMFDDHEVTDDWYLSKSWRSRVVDGAVRAGGDAQRLLRLRGLPGVGQRSRRRSPTPARRRSRRTRSCSTRSRRSAPRARSRTRSSDKLDGLFGLDGPLKDPQVTFHYNVPGPAAHGPRARHAHATHVQGPARPAEAARRQPRRAAPRRTADRRPRAARRRLAGARSCFPRALRHADPAARGAASSTSRQRQAARPRPTPTARRSPGNEDFDVEGWGGDEDGARDDDPPARAPTRARSCSPATCTSRPASRSTSGTGRTRWSTRAIVQLTSSARAQRARAATEGDHPLGPLQPAAPARPAVRAARLDGQVVDRRPRRASRSRPPGGPAAQVARPPARRRAGRPGTTIPADKPPDWRWRLTVLRDDTPARADRPPRSAAAAAAGVQRRRSDRHLRRRSPACHAQLALEPDRAAARCWSSARTSAWSASSPTAPTSTVVHELWSVDGPDVDRGRRRSRSTASSLALARAPRARQLEVVPDG